MGEPALVAGSRHPHVFELTLLALASAGTRCPASRSILFQCYACLFFYEKKNNKIL